MECPNCKAPLPEGATFCGACGWKIAGGTLDRTVHNLAQVGKDVLRESVVVAEKSARALQPVVEKIEVAAKEGFKAAKPAVDKAAEATSTAVDKGVKATKSALKKAASTTERAAKKVKEKVR